MPTLGEFIARARTDVRVCKHTIGIPELDAPIDESVERAVEVLVANSHVVPARSWQYGACATSLVMSLTLASPSSRYLVSSLPYLRLYRYGHIDAKTPDCVESGHVP